MREDLQAAALKQIAIMNRQLLVLQEQLELTEQLVVLSGNPELPEIEPAAAPAADSPQSDESFNDICALCGHTRYVHRPLACKVCHCSKFTPANKAGLGKREDAETRGRGE